MTSFARRLLTSPTPYIGAFLMATSNSANAQDSVAPEVQNTASAQQGFTLENLAQKIVDLQLDAHPDIATGNPEKNYLKVTQEVLEAAERALADTENPDATQPAYLYPSIMSNLTQYIEIAGADQEFEVSDAVEKQSSIVNHVYNTLNADHLLEKPPRFFLEKFALSILQTTREETSLKDVVAQSLNKTGQQYDEHTLFWGATDAKRRADKTKGIAVHGGIGADVTIDYQPTIEEAEAGLPFRLKQGLKVVGLTSPNAAAAKAGVKSGDIITHANGVPLAGKTQNEAIAEIVGDIGSFVSLTLIRDDATITLSNLQRAIVEKSPVEAKLLPEYPHIGYIKIESFNDKLPDDFDQAIITLRRSGATKFIFDLTNNVGGHASGADHIIDSLIDAPDNTQADYNRTFTFKGRNQIVGEAFVTSGRTVEEPVAVLVNGNSASSSEIVAGVLQIYNRAAIIGIDTFGKGIGQSGRAYYIGSDKTLDGSLKYTQFHYYIGQGEAKEYSIHKRGVKPDILLSNALRINDPAPVPNSSAIPHPPNDWYPDTKSSICDFNFSITADNSDTEDNYISCAVESLGIDVPEIEIQ